MEYWFSMGQMFHLIKSDFESEFEVSTYYRMRALSMIVPCDDTMLWVQLRPYANDNWGIADGV